MDNLELPRLIIAQKTGEEPFHRHKQPLEPPLKLGDFWRWGCSDLVDNMFRGRLAEFYVASALRCLDTLQNAWGCHDVTYKEKITIQVKCSGYLQGWFQKTFSDIKFDIKPKLSWNPNTNAYEGIAARHSTLYVFCLHEHKDKATLDPMDVAQWVFYVIRADKLPKTNSIRLKALRALQPAEARYHTLRETIEQC
jgi:hypothetical protein